MDALRKQLSPTVACCLVVLGFASGCARTQANDGFPSTRSESSLVVLPADRNLDRTASTSASPTTTARSSGGIQTGDVAVVPPLVVETERLPDLYWALSTLEIPYIRECMQRQGFEYRETPPELPSSVSMADVLDRRYLAPRLLPSGAIGYAETEVDSDADGRSLQPDLGDTGPAFEAAFRGSIVDGRTLYDGAGNKVMLTQIGDGCLGQAQSAVFGSPEAYLDFVVQLHTIEIRQSDSLASLLGDARFLSSMAAWSECMKASGLDFDTVFGPADAGWAPPRPGRAEQATAAIDRACRDRTNVGTGALASLEASLEEGQLANLPFSLEEFRRASQDLIDRATRSRAAPAS